MSKKVRRKQIVKLSRAKVKTANDWLFLEYYKREAELEREIYRRVFDSVWKEWFGDV